MCPSVPPEKVFWAETFKNWLLTTTQVIRSRIVTKVWEKESHSSADQLIIIFFPVNCTCRKRIPSLTSEIPRNHPGCFLLPAHQKFYSWNWQAGNWPGSSAHNAPAELPGTQPLHNPPKAPLPASPPTLAERHRRPRPLPLAQPSCVPLGKLTAKFLNRKACLKTKTCVSGNRDV